MLFQKLFGLSIWSLILLTHPVETKSAPKEKATVVTKKAEKIKLADTLIYPAVVDSKINALINAEAVGLVKKILVEPGVRAQRGQTLVVLENPDPVYKYSPIYITAPVTGVISSIDVSLLSRVERGQKIAAITDPSNLRIKIEVPASDLSFLKIGQEGKFRVKLKSEEYHLITIIGLSPLIDPKTGTASGTIEIKDKSILKNLHPGEIGQVRFETNERQQILLPESAITYRDGKTWVRIIENGKSKKRIVTLGNRIGDSFEVKSGLEEQSSVVIRANRFIADDEEVIVENSERKE